MHGDRGDLRAARLRPPAVPCDLERRRETLNPVFGQNLVSGVPQTVSELEREQQTSPMIGGLQEDRGEGRPLGSELSPAAHSLRENYIKAVSGRVMLLVCEAVQFLCL